MKSWLNKLISRFSLNKKKVVSKLESPEEMGEEQVAWWGSFSVEEEQSRYFKIGNIVLCLDRYNHEWNITTYREGEQPFKSFATQAPNEIILKPTLPNRSLLVKLDRAFYIPPGETLQLYAGIPIWIKIEAGKPAIALDEIPTETLADTWFGKNTLDGELCYASKIHCSVRLEDLPSDNIHVTTPISIQNRSRETIILRELKVPLPYLSIYSDIQNHLWTEQVHLTGEDLDPVEMSVIKGPPPTLKGPALVNIARIGSKSGLKDLFSPFKWK